MATFKLDRKGVGEVLHSMAPKVDAISAAVAEQIRADYPDVEVDVELYSTDRAAGVVMVKDSRGKELQLKEGILTRAAAAVGLEVRSR